jgi:hypothetical protein
LVRFFHCLQTPSKPTSGRRASGRKSYCRRSSHHQPEQQIGDQQRNGKLGEDYE